MAIIIADRQAATSDGILPALLHLPVESRRRQHLMKLQKAINHNSMIDFGFTVAIYDVGSWSSFSSTGWAAKAKTFATHFQTAGFSGDIGLNP